MKIVTITAGAAGMFCGSCLRDNTLTCALRQLGHDALLLSTYMPIRTDEIDVSEGRIFYGGINVYLQEKSWLFRHTPRFMDRLLDAKSLLRWASRRAVTVDYADFAELTLSMLRGQNGRQKKELNELVSWLVYEAKPDVVILTNALLSGIVPTLRDKLPVPILTTLQGDDIFLDALPRNDRQACIAQIQANDLATTGYLATSHDYAERMAIYLGLPREKIQVVYPGIATAGYPEKLRNVPNEIPTIGYFARICPEKGFQNLVDAYIRFRKLGGLPRARLRAGGWKGAGQEAFFQTQLAKLKQAELAHEFEYVDCPTLEKKVDFLTNLDLFTVPTTYLEPKGLSVLEAWAAGVPVVQPRHGSFPELIAEVPGGLLYTPQDHDELARLWLRLFQNPSERLALAEQGFQGVRQHFSAKTMAEQTILRLERLGMASAEASSSPVF